MQNKKYFKHENTTSNKSAKEFEQIIPTGPLQNILNHVARLKLGRNPIIPFWICLQMITKSLKSIGSLNQT
jgi:hypothetical protein